MKHSNPAMRKPPLGKIDHDLEYTKIDITDPDAFVMCCQECSKEWVFYKKDIPYSVIRCPECGHEEIFMSSNFKWVKRDNLSESRKDELAKLFALRGPR